MNYIVPNMTLITQDKTMSCWYASGQMLIQWRRNTKQMTEALYPDPSQVERWGKLYDQNPGIMNPQIPAFADDLGLQMVPPMSPTPEGLLGLLTTYGPLWINGKVHITVIAGIRDTNDDIEVLVFDPDPAYSSYIYGQWRKLRDWYVLDPSSGRDTGSDVQTVFLYVPT
jgi:hypothetical protein